MKLTTKLLRQLIKEELDRTLEEGWFDRFKKKPSKGSQRKGDAISSGRGEVRYGDPNQPPPEKTPQERAREKAEYEDGKRKKNMTTKQKETAKAAQKMLSTHAQHRRDMAAGKQTSKLDPNRAKKINTIMARLGSVLWKNGESYHEFARGAVNKAWEGGKKQEAKRIADFLNKELPKLTKRLPKLENSKFHPTINGISKTPAEWFYKMGAEQQGLDVRLSDILKEFEEWVVDKNDYFLRKAIIHFNKEFKIKPMRQGTGFG